MNGVIIVNKPKGITSHDVVRNMRRIAQQRDVGHLGTLDPMATGVLPLVLGNMTRLAQFYDRSEKEYEGTIVFGLATDTYDAEGKVVGEPVSATFSRKQLEAALEKFRREIEQVPPPYSAKKIAGVPAYKLARKNEEVKLRAVKVTIHKLELLDFAQVPITADLQALAGNDLAGLRLASMKFRAVVSSGTYIRSLAHDLGQRLGAGAFLQSLCRTRSAEFSVAHAHTIEELEQKAAAGELSECAIPARELLPNVPNVNATDDQMTKIRHGNAVNLAEFSQSELAKVFFGGELVAIARRVAGTLFQPKIVLAA